jgi:uncharacterized membrane protein
MAEKMRVLLVGETWFVLKMHIKGFDMVPLGGYEDFSVWFRDAMDTFEDIDLVHMPNHIALTAFPSKVEDLKQFDVIIFSDCGKNTISLYPEMFTVPMGPNRLDVVKAYVESGGAFIMCGGWNSFQGIRTIPGYHDTVIEEILPVEIQVCDDRVELPQGKKPEIIKKDHPIFSDLPKEWPLFLGYNRILKKDKGNILATIQDDPFIAVGDFGKGKTMAFSSDLVKHWGNAFIEWEGYGQFWRNVFRWMSG